MDFPLSNSHYRTGHTVGLAFRPSQPLCRLPLHRILYEDRKSLSQLTVRHFGYFAMLLFTIVGSFWLEIVYKVNVLRRFKRLVITIAPVASLFILWDLYAIHHSHWNFDRSQIVGIYLFNVLPLEELLFFLIVPIAAIMTIEAVRAVKKNWVVEE